MSDQDKPTAVEWTPKFVADLVNHGRLTKGGNGWKLVADAHNAALAAERETIKRMAWDAQTIEEAMTKIADQPTSCSCCLIAHAALAKVKEAK